MSPKLPRVTTEDFIRAIQKDGWHCVRQRGSHRFFVHDVQPGIVVVSGHAGKTLKLGLLAEMVKDSGLTPDELEKLL